ncbi:MAG: hypothetical protein KGL25_04785 [Gammaproteobacteria bacterium]|nr:hypothetical protein [Gammaproteobacteria bacterium]MDE2250702.1 hypothetical protein [Gammaproteobacteria bacterium]
MSASHAQPWLPVALLLALALSVAVRAADEAAPPRADCDPERETSWPPCRTGTLCWCAGDVEYRRDKVILNDLVLYQGGSPLLVRAKRAETPSTDTADSTWNLSGGVRSRLAQGQLAADNATVHFEASSLTAAMFDGTPATFEETPAPGSAGAAGGALGNVKGSAHTIEYDNVAGGEVRLRGDVQLYDGCKDIHGDGFVYNLTQKSLKSLEPVAGSGRERIRGTFQQKCRPAAGAAAAGAGAGAQSTAPAPRSP